MEPIFKYITFTTAGIAFSISIRALTYPKNKKNITGMALFFIIGLWTFSGGFFHTAQLPQFSWLAVFFQLTSFLTTTFLFWYGSMIIGSGLFLRHILIGSFFFLAVLGTFLFELAVYNWNAFEIVSVIFKTKTLDPIQKSLFANNLIGSVYFLVLILQGNRQKKAFHHSFANSRTFFLVIYAIFVLYILNTLFSLINNIDLYLYTAVYTTVVLVTISYQSHTTNFYFDKIKSPESKIMNGMLKADDYRKTEAFLGISPAELGTKIEVFFMNDELYLQNDMKLNQLANLLEIRPDQLSSYFNNILQISFRDYLNELRVRKAKQLMDASTEQPNFYFIGVKSGFSSTAVFYRRFRRSTGMSPKEYYYSNLKENSKSNLKNLE